ncbi:phytoene desaturase family protein [Hymenobacter cellulosivorans]|uniref:Phytoene desaturase family protein n=1 Tax=Hymenobacter cellulosivorans TaxID=2932249 RepID=A0ABY4FH74_9BACT|nr:phytoene desaturase family protein [Hymenobacter cellulosivorans]UOQ55486.1 phytoene desaturase family protein [Hymenobacter cellulosivorans]
MTTATAPPHVLVIGAGFAGLSAATSLAQRGYRVTVLEKNEGPGGRARVFQAQGFTFDMGPSWYWMPDVFEKYFARFGRKVSDYYELERLDPSYQVVFGPNDAVDIPAKMAELRQLFEHYEPGSAARLDEFLKQAAYKYEVGINRLVYAPSRSVFEFADPKLLVDMVRMDVLQSMHKHVRRFFRNPKLLQLVEFPILFLGATSENTPALYSLMNYADLALGTWYPKGGMHQIVRGMVQLAQEQGVVLEYNQEVQEIQVENGRATGVQTATGFLAADIVVAGADYHHAEQHLLRPEFRHYDEAYWDKRTMAPSSLLFYIGLNKRLPKLRHHNLFFDEDFQLHAHEIYEQPQWPSKPLFYVSAPSQTDPTVAPDGCENLFLLIPVAPNLPDPEQTREHYYHLIMDRLERHVGENIRDAVVYKRSYAHQDFISDYHSYKGNAYGLANTLRQTAILKPTLKSKKISNLYFTGQLTVPGPGVPPSLISGQVVAGEVEKEQGLVRR